MRGMASRLNDVTPAVASASTSSRFTSGCSMPTTAVPDRKDGTSSSRGRVTITTRSASASSAVPSGTIRAPASV